MSHSVMVPLDGTGFAEHALVPAADVARRSGARLELVTAYRSQMPVVRTAGAPVHDPRVDAERIGELKGYLERTGALVSREFGVPTAGTLVHGAPAEALARRVAVLRPALIVIATHGRGGLSRMWLGSVAADLLRLVESPMLAVKPGVDSQACRFPPRDILVPLDGSERAERAVEDAAWVSARDGVRFTLLRMVSPPASTPFPLVFASGGAGTEAEAVAAAGETLRPLVARLEGRGFEVRSRVVVDGESARAILTAAESGPCDLIAMAAHGFDPLRRALVGSVADQVVRGSRMPVLLRRM